MENALTEEFAKTRNAIAQPDTEELNAKLKKMEAWMQRLKQKPKQK